MKNPTGGLGARAVLLGERRRAAALPQRENRAPAAPYAAAVRPNWPCDKTHTYPWWSGYGCRLQGTFASLGANGLYIDQRPPLSRAVWAQAARVEAMRAVPRAAEAEADDEATDDEAEAAAEEDELLLGCI